LRTASGTARQHRQTERGHRSEPNERFCDHERSVGARAAHSEPLDVATANVNVNGNKRTNIAVSSDCGDGMMRTDTNTDMDGALLFCCWKEEDAVARRLTFVVN